MVGAVESIHLGGWFCLFYRIKQMDLSFEETLISFWCFLIGRLTFYTLGLVRNDIGSAVSSSHDGGNVTSPTQH